MTNDSIHTPDQNDSQEDLEIQALLKDYPTPQADAGWMGEAGPGPSYMDSGSGGPENDFTNRNTTFLVWNTLHTARWLKDAGGFPAHGNQPDVWDSGCHTDFHSPEHKR